MTNINILKIYIRNDINKFLVKNNINIFLKFYMVSVNLLNNYYIIYCKIYINYMTRIPIKNLLIHRS